MLYFCEKWEKLIYLLLFSFYLATCEMSDAGPLSCVLSTYVTITTSHIVCCDSRNTF